MEFSRSIFFSSRPFFSQGLAIVRVVVSVMIFYHGLEFFDPAAMKDLRNFLTDMHCPAPGFMAPFAKMVEMAGGTLLAVGLFTRWVCLPLMFEMLLVTWWMGGGSIFVSEGSSLFFLLFLSFFITGPGSWSLDFLWFDRNKNLVR